MFRRPVRAFSAHVRTTVLLCAIAAISTSTDNTAWASGFVLPDQSAAALARAGAVTASLDDASAVYQSPAALSFMADQGATATVGVVTARTQFAPQSGDMVFSSQRQLRAVPSLFGHLRAHDRVQVGVGVFAPYGFAVRWPTGWPGAEHALHASLRVLAANPVMAVRVHRTLSLALGTSILRGDVDLGLALPQLIGGGSADLAAVAWGATWNAALLWRPLHDDPERLRVALTYRAGTDLNFKGDARFQTQPGYEDTFSDQKARVTLPLPDMVTLAVAGRPVGFGDVSADLTWTRWSVFDEFLIDLENFNPLTRRDSRDTLTFAVGGSHTLSSLPLTVRSGVRYDQSITRGGDISPSTPDADRIGVGLGVGWRVGRLVLDLGYLYTHFLDAHARNAVAGPLGRYRTRLHALVVSVTVN